MRRTKSRNEQHLIDDAGVRLLRSRLPPDWVLRDYKPDYGIDFALEIFRAPDGKGRNRRHYETLGEHIFIQLKSTETCRTSRLKIYGRHNVEKKRESLDRGDPIGELVTARQSVDTFELATIERMGIGLPVLLVVADLKAGRCYFVCVNDYIDKILAARHDDYASCSSRTIHVPVLNEIGDPRLGQVALSWYSKRSKLIAAFQRFVFQSRELKHAENEESALELARHFASRIERYDLWEATQMWRVIDIYGRALRRFIETGNPNPISLDGAPAGRDGASDGNSSLSDRFHAQRFWDLLALLPGTYEDICREWFLPTAIGFLSSYTGKTHTGSFHANLATVCLDDCP